MKIVLHLCCWIGLAVSSADAAQLQALPVESALDIRAFARSGSLQFSPDGRELLCAIYDNRRLGSPQGEWIQKRSVGLPMLMTGTDVALIDMSSGEMRSLTGGDGTNWGASWSPDGHFVAFLSDRGGNFAALWVWEAGTGKLRKVSDLIALEWEGEPIQWLPDSRTVLLAVLPHGVTPAQYATRMLGGKEQTASSGNQTNESLHVPGSTVTIYRASAVAKDAAPPDQLRLGSLFDLDSDLRDLVAVDVFEGTARPVDRGGRISHYALSPDGRKVVISRAERYQRDSFQELFELSVLDLTSGESKSVARDLHLQYDGSVSWAPSSSRIAYWSQERGTVKDVFVLDLTTALGRRVTEFSPDSSTFFNAGPLWDAGGRTLYVLHQGALWKIPVDSTEAAMELAQVPGRSLKGVVTNGDDRVWSPDGGRSLLAMTYDNHDRQSGFYRIDMTNGGTTRLLEHGECYDCVVSRRLTAVKPDGKMLVYFSGDAQHDVDLWLSDPAFRHPRRLSRLNSQFDRCQMGAARLVEWRSLDGQLLHGALLLPAGYREGQRYPLIVGVYGGSNLSEHIKYFGLEGDGVFNQQLFATRGYAVLFPDAPLDYADPLAGLAKTVLPGVDRVIDLGIADPERLGLWGHSYGGFCTLALIVQTARFKAAVAADGFGDQTGRYGQMLRSGASNGAGGLEGLGVAPWQQPQRYIENSPVFYLNRVETPLLLVHGEEDVAVKSFLSDEVFTMLRGLGKEVEYVTYAGEGHSPVDWSYANQLDVAQRLVDWFDRHLNAHKTTDPAERK